MASEELVKRVQGRGDPRDVWDAHVFTLDAVKLMAELTADVKVAVEVLSDSSQRLERLTGWLIGLTATLAVLTLVLAAPELGKLLVWHRGH